MVAVLKPVKVLAWNVKVSRPREVILSSLQEMFNSKNPHVCTLNEVTPLFGHLGGLGYQVVQLRPKTIRKGNVSNTANVAVLVRNDLEIVKTFTQRMTEFWRGPMHNLPQDPRVYRWVKVRINGEVWIFGAAHVPFGIAARAETVAKLVKRILRYGNKPISLTVDANMSVPEFHDRVAVPAKAQSGGEGPDQILVKNADILSAENLGHHGSDHPVMFYKLLVKKH